MTQEHLTTAEPHTEDATELFELELMGGGVERRYRRQRPEVEQMPWGTLDVASYDPDLVLAAREGWTRAAFQEHRTAVACAKTLQVLIQARAPLDLIAMATRFPLDEIVHVELCSRMAMELGGAVQLFHDPCNLVKDARPELDALMQAADLIVRFFCVGEALSIPMLRGTWRASAHPLPRAILSRITRDEASHGTFGWRFVDWARPNLGPEDCKILGEAADETIRSIEGTWQEIRKRPRAPTGQINALGWMQSEDYLELAARSMRTRVIEPLRARGIPISAAET